MARNTQPVPTAAIAIPATAGPTMRALLNVALLRLTALARSSGPTISLTNDCRTGVSMTPTTPSPTASAYTCQSVTAPDRSSTASVSARTAIAACARTSRRRRS